MAATLAFLRKSGPLKGGHDIRGPHRGQPDQARTGRRTWTPSFTG
jgi:hypothetical protein